jgi:predicted fused transcriptional regulator/phosphomethylpyrimidine kinase
MDPAQERAIVIERLETALVQLQPLLDFRLIPSGGLSFVYGMRGARDTGGIAGVSGGVTCDGDKKLSGGPVGFGTDENGARIVLTAMKFDPVVRSAAVLRYSPGLMTILGQMFLECRSFDRVREPPCISTMDFGVASCCRDGVPDVIFDLGAPGKEALVRLFGENPDAVANNIIILSNRILNIEI